MTTPQRFPQNHRRQREKAAGDRFEKEDRKPWCHCRLLYHTSPQSHGESCRSQIQALLPSSSATAGWEPPAAPTWFTVTASSLLAPVPAPYGLSSARPPWLRMERPLCSRGFSFGSEAEPTSPPPPPACSDLDAPALRPLSDLSFYGSSPGSVDSNHLASMFSLQHAWLARLRAFLLEHSFSGVCGARLHLLQDEALWLRQGHRRHGTSCDALDHQLREKPAAMASDRQVAMRSCPCDKKPGPPANSRVTVPSQERTPWHQASLQRSVARVTSSLCPQQRP